MRGHMKVRLTQNADEIAVAQKLRHRVFHEDRGLSSDNIFGLDADTYDAIAHHLLVIEPAEGRPSEFALADGNLVGTYRLITQEGAAARGGFYSEQEYDLSPLLTRKPELRFLELGRSCILKEARGAQAVELLWQGIWDFVREHKIDVMLGCASFEGTDVVRHAEALRFLARHGPVPAEWHVMAKAERVCTLPSPPSETRGDKNILQDLPPLVKGYLRLGCYFGEGCVIDHEFNTIDVLVILPVAAINPRYFARFGRPIAS
jgi:L-ornithine Nalpha-acyltransferase